MPSVEWFGGNSWQFSFSARMARATLPSEWLPEQNNPTLILLILFILSKNLPAKKKSGPGREARPGPEVVTQVCVV